MVALRRWTNLDTTASERCSSPRRWDSRRPSAVQVIDHLGLREDVECFKEFRIGKSRHGRYSPAAMRKIKAALAAEPIEQIWARDRAKRRGPR